MEEVERQLESDPLDIPAEDELGLGASASPTSTSSIPTPPPQPPSPPTPYFSSGDGKRDIKDGLSTTQRSWQVDNVPSTSTSRRTGSVWLSLSRVFFLLRIIPKFENLEIVNFPNFDPKFLEKYQNFVKYAEILELFLKLFIKNL